MQVWRVTPCAPLGGLRCGAQRTARPTKLSGHTTALYAAFFSPDNAPRIFFIHAEKRWRFCSRRTTASLVTQLNWITRRGPENGLWPCHELLLRRNANSVPSVGGTSRIMSSRLFPERSNRSRPPADSQPGFI